MIVIVVFRVVVVVVAAIDDDEMLRIDLARPKRYSCVAFDRPPKAPQDPRPLRGTFPQDAEWSSPIVTRKNRTTTNVEAGREWLDWFGFPIP